MHPFLVFITIVIALWAQGTRKPPPPTKVTALRGPSPFVMQDGVWYTVH